MNKRINMLFKFLLLLAITVMLLQPDNVWAQSTRTLGLIKRNLRAYEGYNLYKPLGGSEVYLINNAGNPVHKWTIPAEFLPRPEGIRPGGEVFLRKNGELVLTADWGIAAIDKDSKIAWKIDSRDLGQGRWFGHHEFVELPNGNMLLPGFIEKTRAEAESAGFNVALVDQCTNGPDLSVLRVDNIWEVAPIDPQAGFKSGWKVVWRWNLWDHIIQDNNPAGPNYRSNIADFPNKADIGYIDPAEKICGNFIQGAWTFGRFNALGYNANRDEIVVSESLMNEIWIINHKITTEEAKGPAGDLLYRWGNPYAHGAGDPFVSAANRGDQQLSFQHRVQWIPQGFPGSGNILIFNNGTDWGDSSVIEVRPPIGWNGKYLQPGPRQPFGPEKPTWQYNEYRTPGSFFAPFISSAQRLPNGNTLINNGPAGYFFEVTSRGQKVWEYINPTAGAAQGDNATFGAYRIWRYASNYQGFAGMDLTPGDPLERYPKTCAVDIKPGQCNNLVYKRFMSSLPVAILGSTNFNVTTIDPRSILFEGFPAAMWYIKDVGKPGNCYGRDGYPDLVLIWDSNVVQTALANASDGVELMLLLTGYSSGGWFLGGEEVSILK